MGIDTLPHPVGLPHPAGFIKRRTIFKFCFPQVEHTFAVNGVNNHLQTHFECIGLY